MTIDRSSPRHKARCLARRQALGLLGGTALAAFASWPGRARARDLAAFNRGYIAQIIVPRFAALRAACGAWNDMIRAMLDRPSAGKADLMGRGDERVWQAWLAAEPFMYQPHLPGKPEDVLLSWVSPSADIGTQLDTALATGMTTVSVKDSLLERHGLLAAGRLLRGRGDLPDTKTAFYLSNDGPSRTTLLQVIVGKMLAQAEAVEATWLAMSQNDTLSGLSVKATTIRFFQDQIDLLDELAGQVIGAPARGLGDTPPWTPLDRMSRSRIVAWLQTASGAVLAPGGLFELAGDGKTQLREALETAFHRTEFDIRAKGYLFPRVEYRADTAPCGIEEICTDDQRQRRADELNRENRRKIEELVKLTLDLRNLLATDLAEAAGLAANSNKT
jgi:hypothetical protein